MAEENADDKKPVDLSENPAFKQMVSMVGELGKAVQGLTAGQTATNDAIGKLAKANTPKDPEEKGPTDEEIDSMTQTEFASHIFAANRKMLDTLGQELGKKISGLTEATSSNQLKGELREFRKDHPDLDDWLPEITGAIKDGRFVNIGDAYRGVKADNPDKTVEIDAKYKDDTDDNDGGEKPGSFGGLLPTSRVDGADGKGEEGELTKAEAGDKAWEEVFGDSPELAGDDSD